MSNFIKFDDVSGDMYMISGSGMQIPVSGAKTPGFVPIIQSDGLIQWGLVSGSGGGGGGGSAGDTFSYWDSTKPFDTPSVYDADFSRMSSFPTGAASYSNGYVGDFLTASYNDKTPGALITQGNDGNWHGKALVIPAGDFNIAMQVKVMGDATDFVISQLGLTATISETVANVSIQVGYRSAFGGWSIHAESETGSANIHNWGVQQVAEDDVILRWRRIGTTYWAAWSTDGRQWSEGSGSAILLVPNWFLFLTYGNSSQATGVNGVAYKWIRYVPTGSAQNFGGFRQIGSGGTATTASLAVTASYLSPILPESTVFPISDSIYARFDARWSLISQSNGYVWQWNDMSGNGNHLVSTGSLARPIYLARGFNGHPCVMFNGRTNSMKMGQINIPQPFSVVSVLMNYTTSLSSGNDVNLYRSQDQNSVAYINNGVGQYAMFSGLVFSGSNNDLYARSVQDVENGKTSNPGIRIDVWSGSTGTAVTSSITWNGYETSGGSPGTARFSGSFVSVGSTISGNPESVTSPARMYLASMIFISRSLNLYERQQICDYFYKAYEIIPR